MKKIIGGLIAGASALAVASGLFGVASAAPVWESGRTLGRIDNAPGLDQAALRSQSETVAQGVLRTGSGELKAFRSETDKLGDTHVRLQQYFRGKPVYGADFVLHVRGSGDVYLLNGNRADARGAPAAAKLNADAALAKAVAALNVASYTKIGAPELAYVVGFDGVTVHLAWRTLIEYDANGKFSRDYVFADANSGALAAVHPTIKYAKTWRTYDGNRNAWNSTAMPGTLLCTNNQLCPLTDAQDAHDGASATYDYYLTKFGRLSLDNNDLALISSVNVCDYNKRNCRYWNNAAWIGTQMVYGDGDGTNFSELSGDVDVIGHELTHGVTDYTSNLVYANASGALNEALSDIFGASVEAWLEGGVNGNTWKLGEDIYTPAVAGDALRYMDNPTLDGYSRDYYPERIAETSTPSNQNDQGGVHGNSGIYNLAYVLLVQGGAHPRGKTSIFVNGVGLSKAEQIMYRANSVYYTSSTGYQAAADGAAQAALDLYGAVERQAALDAFCAVGVGTNCGGSGGIAPVAAFTLSCPTLTCSFTDASSDADGTIVSRSWNFGDGQTSTATNPSHSYAAGGTYTVTLTVTDNDGKADSASQTINVSTGGGDNTPPVISNVTSTKGSGGNFTVRWTTDEPATSVLRIPSANYTNSDSTLVTSHALTQRGSKNATYIYYVDSVDAAGNIATAGPFTHQN